MRHSRYAKVNRHDRQYAVSDDELDKYKSHSINPRLLTGTRSGKGETASWASRPTLSAMGMSCRQHRAETQSVFRDAYVRSQTYGLVVDSRTSSKNDSARLTKTGFLSGTLEYHVTDRAHPCLSLPEWQSIRTDPSSSVPSASASCIAQAHPSPLRKLSRIVTPENRPASRDTICSSPSIEVTDTTCLTKSLRSRTQAAVQMPTKMFAPTKTQTQTPMRTLLT